MDNEVFFPGHFHDESAGIPQEESTIPWIKGRKKSPETKVKRSYSKVPAPCFEITFFFQHHQEGSKSLLIQPMYQFE